MSGNVKKYSKNKGYESLNRNMLQDEDNLSLAAIGLLANLTSYPDGWTVHKTELYNRFAKSGRRVVERAWKELIENNYVVQLRKRNGRKYDYIYYHSQVPFTEDDKKSIEITEGVPIWDGRVSKPCNEGISSTVQNEQSKLNSTKRTHNKLTSKEINNKDLDTIDTNDTNHFIKNKINSNTLSEDDKRKRKERYIKEAFNENNEFIPKELANMLDAFSSSIEDAERYYNIILIAKKKVEEETLELIWLEDEPKLLSMIINAFSRSIKRIEQKHGEPVNKPEAFIYQTIYNTIATEISHRQRLSSHSV